MIVFDLHCCQGHRFEGWFASSSAYDDQRAGGLLACPQCGSSDVKKSPMAPAVPIKGNRSAVVPAKGECATGKAMPLEILNALRAVAEMQAKTLPSSEWVGDQFTTEVRRMHRGEQDEKLVHGRATREDAEALADEGIAIAPLLVPFCPPEERN